MTKAKIILTGAAGVAAAALAASPASAQYYPQYPNQGQNVIGSIIGSVLGYGQYPYGNYGYGQNIYMRQQTAIDQCARLTEARLNNMVYNYGYNRYNPYQNNPYSGWAVQGRARVLGIDNVQVKKYGRLKVTGVATSGRSYAQPYGYGRYGYNAQFGVPDLRFSCKADSSGRVYDVDIDRNTYRRR